MCVEDEFLKHFLVIIFNRPVFFEFFFCNYYPIVNISLNFFLFIFKIQAVIESFTLFFMLWKAGGVTSMIDGGLMTEIEHHNTRTNDFLGSFSRFGCANTCF